MLAPFRTNICIVWNMTKTFGTIPDKTGTVPDKVVTVRTKLALFRTKVTLYIRQYFHCPEYDQNSWHYSGQIFALSGM